MGNTVTDIRQIMIFRNKERKQLKEEKFLSQSMSKVRTYSLNDYNWSENFNMDGVNTDISNDKIPKLILTEFQPERSYNFDEITKTLGTFVNNALTSGKGGKGLVDKVLGGLAKTAIQTGVTAQQSLNFETFADTTKQEAIDGVAMRFVRGLFTGQYLNVYEIPFFGNEYLIADTKSSWSESGSDMILGKEASKTLKENFSVNFPMSPVWNKASETKLNWKNTFHLINNTTDNLVRNLKFLNALISGSYWLQLGIMQQSPNVYDVVCPGRFHQYFTALSVEVNFKGKLRENEKVSKEMGEMGYNGFVSDNNKVLFPGAYEVIIKASDLSPNNFNVYMDTIIGKDKVTVGDTRSRYGSAADIGGILSDVGKGVLSEGSAMLNKVFGG
jgi:hypothetical protein